MENKVYIVIVNYKNFEDTIECLESVLKSTYKNFQIILIDNSPDNLSVGAILSWSARSTSTAINTQFNYLVYPLVDKPVSHFFAKAEDGFLSQPGGVDCKLILVKTTNRGYAAANNIAFKYILKQQDDQPFIWLLNNDTVVEKNTLSNLVSFYQHHESGRCLVGAKLRHYYEPGVIQAIAGHYNKWLGRHVHIGSGEEDTGQYDSYQPVKMDYIVGASIFLPKQFLEETGMMCEDYFLYFEELDWMKTGAKHGFTLALAPNAIVYHKEGSSIIEHDGQNQDISIAEYYSITSRVRFIRKWYPYCLPTVMIGVIYALLKRMTGGKFNLVKQASKAIIIIWLGGNAPLFKNDK